jgi:hypothetical protein
MFDASDFALPSSDDLVHEALSSMVSPEDAFAAAALNGVTADEWKSKLLPTTKRIYDAFNGGKTQYKPSPSDKCFFCKYWGENKTAIIGGDALTLREFANRYYSSMDLVEFIRIMHEKYDKLRTNVNARLRFGEIPLPEMSEMQIYTHFTTHTHDLQTKVINRLRAYQEAIEEGNKLIIEQTGSGKNKKKRLNAQTIAQLEKLTRMEAMYHKFELQKMLFFNNGKHVSTVFMEQGNVDLANKQLIEMHEQELRETRKRKRT